MVRVLHAGFNLQVGQAVHIGALTRLGLIEASAETIYVTVWASPNVSLHMGKVENADEVWSNHVGVRLQVSPFLFAYQNKHVSINNVVLYFILLKRFTTAFCQSLAICVSFD